MAKYRLGFEAYGVKAGIQTNRKYFLDEILRRLPLTFPVEYSLIDFEDSTRRFSINSENNGKFRVNIEEEIDYLGTDRDHCVDLFLSHVRIKVAEYAESKVFLHAGVVGYKGKAIVLPGTSFTGKSSLVAQLVKAGCEYYSDEYAVLNEEGFILPYPKMISLRGFSSDKFAQKDFDPGEFGVTGTEPIPAGVILFSEYAADAHWDPQNLSIGDSVMEVISHTLSIRYRPEFTLQVLNKTFSRAIILKSARGDASKFAFELIKYIDKYQPSI